MRKGLLLEKMCHFQKCLISGENWSKFPSICYSSWVKSSLKFWGLRTFLNLFEDSDLESLNTCGR